MVHINKVKKIFHDEGVQVSTNAINLIKEDIQRRVYRMAKNCSEGNLKRLNEETFHIAIGNWKKYLK